MAKKKGEKTTWAYRNGKKFCDVTQLAKDKNVTLEEAKTLVRNENKGYAISFEVRK